jgi:hypothetical protein
VPAFDFTFWVKWAMSQKAQTVRFMVEVKRRESDGALFTSHRPMTDGDRDRMAEWPSGGLIQIAHALFIESLRREAYTIAITKMANGSPPDEISVKELDELLRARLLELLEQFSEGAAHNAKAAIAPR